MRQKVSCVASQCIYVGGPCQHTIAANGMQVDVSDHESRFRKDYATGPSRLESREVYRGVKFTATWPQTTSPRNPVHPGRSRNLGDFYRHPRANATGDQFGGDEMNDHCPSGDEDESLEAVIEDKILQRLKNSVAKFLAVQDREAKRSINEWHELTEFVTDVTNRVDRVPTWRTQWVATLRRHAPVPHLPVDETLRDSVLSFADLVATNAHLRGRLDEMRADVEKFNRDLDGDFESAPGTGKVCQSYSVLPRIKKRNKTKRREKKSTQKPAIPAKKRGRH